MEHRRICRDCACGFAPLRLAALDAGVSVDHVQFDPVTMQAGLLDDEAADVRDEAGKLIQDVDRWLTTPNDQLIGTDKEHHVRNLLGAVKHGSYY